MGGGYLLATHRLILRLECYGYYMFSIKFCEFNLICNHLLFKRIMENRAKIISWIKASRLTSQSYIFIPLLLGQAIYYQQSGNFNWFFFIILQLFGIFNQLYIVYANDYADFEADQNNKTFNMFSGGSRVLVNGELEPSQLKTAAFITAGLSVACGLIFWVGFGRFWVLILAVIGILQLWAYSYPPFKLSYRGGGEILQMLGVGLVLPLMGFYGQSGSFEGFPILLIAALLPLQLACASSTSLPDYPSDKSSGKKTSSVLFGLILTKCGIILLSSLTIISVYGLAARGGLDIPIIKVLALPIMATLLHITALNSKPGSWGIMLFNFFTVLANLAIQVGLIIVFFIS